MTDATVPELDNQAAPSTGLVAASDQSDDRRPRRRRVATVEIPEAVHAVAVLTGKNPEEIIEAILTKNLSSLHQVTANALSEALR